jgi:hypothetical protein
VGLTSVDVVGQRYFFLPGHELPPLRCRLLSPTSSRTADLPSIAERRCV